MADHASYRNILEIDETEQFHNSNRGSEFHDKNKRIPHTLKIPIHFKGSEIILSNCNRAF